MTLYILHGISSFLMLALPIALVLIIRKRRNLGWGIFGIGATAFIASQIVHIPLNWGLGQAGVLNAAEPNALTNALILGLTAGLCEETARYIALKKWLPAARDWTGVLGYGIGHGGIEALLVGLFSAIGLLNIVLLATRGPEALGVPLEYHEAALAQLEAYQSNPSWSPVLGLLERVMALTLHVGFTALVVMSLVTEQKRYLAGAIFWHTTCNAVTLIAMPQWGPVGAELVLAVLTGLTLWMLRDVHRCLSAPVSEDGATA